MQNAVLAVVVGASLLGLSMMAAIAIRRHSGMAVKVALGGAIGALGAGIALVVGIDAIPDHLEFIPATLLIIGVASALIVGIATRFR